MESLTYFKNMKITPRKYRAVVRLVRGMKPLQAMNVLKTTNKKAAVSLSKVIKSAITNATTTLKVGDDMLQFKLFTIEEGNKLKRYRAVSRGMARGFIRRMSHIKIIIQTAEVEKAKEEVKTEVKSDIKKVEKVAKADNAAEVKRVEKKSKVTKKAK